MYCSLKNEITVFKVTVQKNNLDNLGENSPF